MQLSTYTKINYTDKQNTTYKMTEIAYLHDEPGITIT